MTPACLHAAAAREDSLMLPQGASLPCTNLHVAPTSPRLGTQQGNNFSSCVLGHLKSQAASDVKIVVGIEEINSKLEIP